MFTKFKKNYIDNNRYIFIIVSILFGLCFIVQKTHGDDFGPLHSVTPFNFINIIKLALLRSGYTFNRLLAYCTCIFFNSAPVWVFVIGMSIAMYILLNSLREMFSKDHEDEKYLNVFIAFMVLTYSYSDMASAGWIITSTMHFFLIASAFTSLIAIKKVYYNQKISLAELFIYIATLIYTSSMEQGMAFMLVIYVLCTIYFIYTKRCKKEMIVLCLISIVCAINTVYCRLGSSRIDIDIIKYFPTIGMINIVNKLDIGLFSTLYWLFFEKHFFTIIIYMVITLLIFIKRKNIYLKIASIFPIFSIIFLNKYMAMNTDVNAFEITAIEHGTSNFGLFNIASVYNVNSYIQYFIYCFMIIVTIVEIYSLINDKDVLFFIGIILLAGMGSRMAMALTPDVFVSHFRTCIYLAFSIIVICITVFKSNINCINIKIKELMNYIFVMCIPILLAYIFVYVYNYMGQSIFELFK